MQPLTLNIKEYKIKFIFQIEENLSWNIKEKILQTDQFFAIFLDHLALPYSPKEKEVTLLWK